MYFRKIFKRVTDLFVKATPPPTTQHFTVPEPVPSVKVRGAKRLVRREIDGVMVNPNRRSKAWRHCRVQCAGMR